MEKHRNSSYIFLIIIFLSIFGFSVFNIFVTFKQKQVQIPKTSQPSNYQPKQADAKMPLEASVGSPDGKWKLTMKAMPAGRQESKGKEVVAHSFTVTNLQDGSKKEIYTKELPLSDTLTIPANTFSPDDKYVFLKESNSNGTNYIVMTASGDPIAKDTQTINFSSLFASKHQDFKITDATGWGGVNLIVFNTDKASGGMGPSFWFEMPSGAFIQLSNRFN